MRPFIFSNLRESRGDKRPHMSALLLQIYLEMED